RRVAIHDAARPLVPLDLLARLEEVSRTFPVTIPGIPLVDTIKEVDEREGVLRTVPRERLRSIQTPQIFHPNVIEKFPNDANPTDEASLAEELGFPVRVVEGSLKNFKITWPEDLIIMERFLSGERE
ncbi:MAG TPA: 2-C-methyl-D-erythritol 4-phosphate cytidylyltransferase, partial [Bdellovibrionota bacterium]|nr:2-C-methyl-D-erythritol 4-phosphate cytidylyltransferase [Bdellovibrionota bacterium]